MTEATRPGHTGADGYLALMRTSPLFSWLPDAELRLVLGRCTIRLVKAGEWCSHEGETAEALFLVLHGRLQAHGGGAVGRELSRGQVFGEIALLTGQGRTAGVRAVRDSELLVLAAAEFDRLAVQYPGWLRQVTRVVVERLVTVGGPPAPEHVLTIAFVSGNPGPANQQWAATTVANGVTKELEQVGPTVLVGFDQAPAAEDRPRWAHELEATHRYVFYETSGPCDWRAWCVQQSDRVVRVVDTEASTPSQLDPALAGDVVGRTDMRDLTVVFVHPPGALRTTERSPTTSDPGTPPLHLRRRRRNVLDGRSAGAFVPSDLARVARILTGRAQGIVLGGGGPRGFAHVGVLQALDEAGIPIDMVGGTSIGAVIGALRAMDLPPAERRELALEAASRNLFVPTLPVLSFSSARKVRRLLESPRFFGQKSIEGCWLPFFCLSANLTRAETVIHESGDLATAVRASLSLPGIFPPVRQGGDFLVDGGVLNNLPVDVMRARVGRGSVIAVDLAVPVEVAAPGNYRETPSGWSLLADRVLRRPNAVATPLALGVLMRAKELAAIASQRELLAEHVPDMLIRPDVASGPMFDFKAARGLIEVGYREAMTCLESGRWLAESRVRENEPVL